MQFHSLHLKKWTNTTFEFCENDIISISNFQVDGYPDKVREGLKKIKNNYGNFHIGFGILVYFLDEMQYKVIKA